MRIKLLSLFCGAALGLSFSAAADVNGDMNQFFNKLGFASNTWQRTRSCRAPRMHRALWPEWIRYFR